MSLTVYLQRFYILRFYMGQVNKAHLSTGELFSYKNVYRIEKKSLDLDNVALV